jgi:multiphosphoryl transfer protein
MPLEFQFTCPLPNGVHARPASALEEVASCFGAEILITNRRTDRTANLKSILAIISADIQQHDGCRLNISGPDCRMPWMSCGIF